MTEREQYPQLSCDSSKLGHGEDGSAQKIAGLCSIGDQDLFQTWFPGLATGTTGSRGIRLSYVGMEFTVLNVWRRPLATAGWQNHTPYGRATALIGLFVPLQYCVRFRTLFPTSERRMKRPWQ